MSKTQERIAAKMPALGVAPMTFHGETLLVKLKSAAEYKAHKPSEKDSDGKVAADLAANILEPDTMKPAFSSEFLTDVLPQARFFELMKSYFKIQNGGTVEDAEKNSAAAPKE